jgi:acetoin utilization deacetylase AcuC-like enzyme
MATGLVWDERYAWHDAGRASTNPWSEPYPALDRPESKRRLWSLLQASGLAQRLVALPARLATREELLRFHSAEYVDRIRDMAAAGGGDAGESARFGPNGYDVARLAAGGCLVAVEAVLEGRVDWCARAAITRSAIAAAGSASSATSCSRSNTRARPTGCGASR